MKLRLVFSQRLLAILMAFLLSLSVTVAPGVALAQTVDDPIVEDPVDEQPVDEEPIDEEPVDEEPVDEEPIDEEPIDEEPVDEEPVDEEPVDEEPVDEEPVDEEPIDEEPVDEEPVEDQPEQRSDSREVQAAWSIHRWIALNIDRPYVQLGQSNGEDNLEVVNANTLSVMSNTPWVLTVQAATDTIAYRGEGADPSKPVSDFLIRSEGSDEYQAMSGAGGEAMVINEGSLGHNQTKVDYLVEVGDGDPSGEYSVVLVYTATTR